MNNPITPFIIQKIPNFVKEKFPDFYQFLIYYFEFLEEGDNPLSVLENFYSNCEINNNEESYVDKILEELGFPSNIDIAIPKYQLIHYLRDFYLARGNKNSFKFFFRLLYGSDVDITYPREKLFVLSNATYSGKYYVFTTATTRNTEYFNQILSQSNDFNITIRGVSSKTTCAVENVFVVIFNGVFYLKIQIDSNILEFNPYEGVEIFIDGTGIKIIETIIGVLDLEITSSGNQYKVGDVINITGCNIEGIAKVKKISSGSIRNITISDGGTGYAVGDQIKTVPTEKGHSFSARVYMVDDDGAITNVEILSPGFNYVEVPILEIKSSEGADAVLLPNSDEIGQIESINFFEPYADITNISNVHITTNSQKGSGFVANPQVKTIFLERKNFQTRRGFLGRNCVLLDSNYYQQFSYEIISNVPQNEYKYIVDDFLHPPGFVRFAKVIITHDEDLNISYNTAYSYVSMVVLFSEDLTFNLSYDTSFDLCKVIEASDQPLLIVNNINNIEFFKNFDNYNTPSSRWNSVNESYFQDNTHIMSDALDAQIDIITP